MTDEGKYWCQHCKRELERSHTGPCPYCGKSGKQGKETGAITVHVKVGAEAVHVTHLNALGWGILILLITIATAAAIAIPLELISQWYKYPVMLVVTVAIVLLMLKLRRSYRFITLCQYLERTASGRRKIS